MNQQLDAVDDTPRIVQVIKQSITWAQTKDRELLLRSFVNDKTLFFFTPDNAGNISGFDQFARMVDKVFMNPAFRAVGAEFHELTVHRSRSGDVAWWSCILNDFNEWQGKPSNWENVRWTGVLEKRDGEWVIMQMHFSYALEDLRRRG